jgi:hypothetical protein
MRKLGNRLQKLESVLGRPDEPQRGQRLVSIAMGRTLKLEKCTCTRTLSSDGFLAEVVDLNGDSPELSQEELDRFVARFPIVRHPDGTGARGAQVSPGGLR